MKKKTTLIFFFLAFTFFYFSAFCQEPPPYLMKVGIGNPGNDYNFGWTPFEVFKTEVETLSKGRLKVELYSQMMGKSSMEMIVMVRDGIVHARDFADGHLATIYPPIQVLSIPYLFAEREIAWKVLDGPFGQKLINDMAEKTGLRPLYWIENGGFRHYSNNKKAVHSPSDMKGLKIRTMEIPLHVKIVSDLGGRAVPLDWGSVYEAIESGIVDGQENSIGTFMIPHFENIQKYIILDGHVYGTYTLLMNEAWYQSLPDDLKIIMDRAKRVSATVNRGLAVINEMKGIEYLKTKGVEVYKPTEEEKRRFRQLTRKSAVKWLKAKVGVDWVQGVLDATSKAEKELGYQY